MASNQEKGYRIIPTPPFNDNELTEALAEGQAVPRALKRRITEYRRTASYHILNDLGNKVRNGDRAAANTISFNSHAQRDWFTFALLSTVIHKLDTQANKEVKEVEEQIEQQRVYYNVKYYIDQDTGNAVIVESNAPKTPLNRSTNLMFA